MSRSTPKDATHGRLSVVSTPIGNLEDITLRALRILKEADVIAAEDTRHTQKLLRHFGISTPLVSFHEHSPPARGEALADRIAAGEHVAYVTDAGTPSVSDPGTRLVQACQTRGLTITVAPGASALSAAMAVSGIAADSFAFYGFLARDGQARVEQLGKLAHSTAASVFFESPNRVQQTLVELAALVGGTRELTVCRELTKSHEQIERKSLAMWVDTPPLQRGEFTLVLAGSEADEAPAIDAHARARELLNQGSSARDAAKRLSFEANLPRKQAYEVVLQASSEMTEKANDA